MSLCLALKISAVAQTVTTWQDAATAEEWVKVCDGNRDSFFLIALRFHTTAECACWMYVTHYCEFITSLSPLY